MEELAKTKDNEKLDQQKFWRLKKKICPKSTDPPSVMLHKTGNLLTTNKAIENGAVEVFRDMEYYIVNRGDERKWNK